jgi:hypothetical protein
LKEEHRLNLLVNKLLRKICGPKRDEVIDRNAEACITRRFMFCTSSPNIIWVIKYRRMKWPEHVARIGTGNLSERVHLVDLGIDGWVILRWFIKKWDGETGTGLIWLGIETVGWRL